MNVKSVVLILVVVVAVWIVQVAQAKYDHIFVLVLENVGYHAIVGDKADAPYITRP